MAGHNPTDPIAERGRCDYVNNVRAVSLHARRLVVRTLSHQLGRWTGLECQGAMLAINGGKLEFQGAMLEI